MYISCFHLKEKVGSHNSHTWLHILFVPPKLRVISFSFPPCIAPAMHIHVVDKWFWFSLFFCRRWRQHYGLILIPICYSGKVQCQVVIMPRFNGAFYTFFKENWIIDKETIYMCSSKPTYLVVYSRISEMGMWKWFFWAPGSIKKVFCPCSD